MFLDEIGDLSPALQSKLLRVLQEKEFERVGGHQTIRVDVRLITATNRNLEELIRQGTFREDFYYRIRAFTINIPPLRQRKEDIEVIADFFIAIVCKSLQMVPKEWTWDFMKALENYDWPGNVRELKSELTQAIVRAGKGEETLDIYHLPENIRMRSLAGTEQDSPPFLQTYCGIRVDPIEAAKFWGDLS